MTEQMKPSDIIWTGDIPKSWDIKRIRFVIKNDASGIKVGPFGSALTNGVIGSNDGSYKVYGQSNLIRCNFDYGDNYVSNENFRQLKSYEIIPGDILVSMMGTIGKCCVVPQNITPGIMDSHLIKIRLSEKVYPEFFVFCYESSIGFEQLILNSKGSIMNGLNSTIVKNVYIPLPPIQEQKAIADFLDEQCTQIDGIVADIERQIETLQQYKKSLITETITKGLDKSAPMKDSRIEWIGEIPEHWSINRVRYLATICSGATPSKDVHSYWEGKIPWISSLEVKTDILYDTSLHISEEAVQSCSTQLMPAGTLVMVVRSGILQHTLPVAVTGIPATINQDIKAFSFSDSMRPTFFKYYVQGANDALLISLSKDKSTVESIDYNLLLSCKVMVPPIVEQDKIVGYLDSLCGTINEIISVKQSQRTTIQQHKKSLIFEYVTGKKRVKEALLNGN